MNLNKYKIKWKIFLGYDLCQWTEIKNLKKNNPSSKSQCCLIQ